MIEPAELLQRACEADHDAFAALLRAHTPALCAELNAQLPARWKTLLSVEDVLQETFTDAFLAIRTFAPRGEHAFLAWLKKIARNNLLEAIRGLEADRRGGGKRPVSLHTAADGRSLLAERLFPAGTQTTPSLAAARSEMNAALDAAVAALPSRNRLAIQLYDLQGKSVTETAEQLGCSPGGVHLLRHRGLQRLRALLASGVTNIRSGA